MKILNEKVKETAKVAIIKTYISGIPAVTNNYKYIMNNGLDKDEFLYIGLFDTPKRNISPSDMREAMTKLSDLLASLSNINLVIDEVHFKDSKDKLHLSNIFKLYLERDHSLWRGHGVLKGDIEGVPVKFIAKMRAEDILREKDSKELIDSGFKIDPDKADVKVIESEEQAKRVFEHLAKASEVAFDTETASLKFDDEDTKIYTVQFTSSDEPDVGYVFYYDHPKVPISDKMKKIVRIGTNLVLHSGAKIIAHNMNFDMNYVMRFFNTDPYKVNSYDTMLILHFLTNSYKQTKLGLKETAFKRGIAPDWDSKLDRLKKEILKRDKIKVADFKYEMFPVKDLVHYAGLDTIATLELFQVLKDDSQKHPAGDIIKVTWEQNWQRIMQSVQQMIYDGVPFNKTNARELEQVHLKRLDHLYEKIAEDKYIQMAEKKINEKQYQKALNEYNKKVSKAREKGKEFTGKKPDWSSGKYGSHRFDLKFSPNSLDHKRILIFDVLKMRAVDKTDSGLPAVGEAQLKEFAKQSGKDILNKFVEIAKIRKELTTYVEPFIEGSEKSFDSRIRGAMTPTAASGRLRSSNFNCLNISKSDIKKSIAPEKGSGLVVVEADYSGLEAVVSLLLTKDEAKLKMREAGVEDAHSISAIIIAKALDEKPLCNFDAKNPDDVKRVKKEFPDHRQNAKGLSFSQRYLGSHRSIQFTYNISEDKAKDIARTYWETYSGERAFMEEKAQEAQDKGYYLNFGNVPILTEGITTDLEDKDNMKNFRTVYNSVSQSSAFATLRAMDKMMRHCKEEGIYFKPFVSVYDSILFTCYPDDLPWIKQTLTKFMTEPIMKDQLFPLEVDFEAGISYKVDVPLGNTDEELQEAIDTLKQKLSED